MVNYVCICFELRKLCVEKAAAIFAVLLNLCEDDESPGNG
jgi:hypothetical protein